MVSEIRYIKASMKLGHTLTLYHKGEKLLTEQAKLISSLARLKDVKEVADGKGLHLTSTDFDCWLDIDETTAQSFVAELQGKITEQEKVIAQLKGRLSNENYVKNAPKHIVAQTRDQLKNAEEQLEKLSQEHARFVS